MHAASRALVHGMCVALVVVGTATTGLAASASSRGGAGQAPGIDAARQYLAGAAVPFVPNAGQWDPQAAFAARTLAGTLFVTAEGRLVYRLPAVGEQANPMRKPTSGAVAAKAASSVQTGTGWSLVESFVQADGRVLAATPRGAQPAAATVSYFTGGDARRHRSGVGTFDRVDLGEVFAGVTVQLRATGSNVEKIFTVAPRQDPRQIRVRIDGATRLEIGSAGELIAHTGNGPVTYTAPLAFQEDAAGIRTMVAVRYDLQAHGTHSARVTADGTADPAVAPAVYAFAVGTYDRAQPLTIDPLLQSTYLGGSDAESVNAILVHPATGEIYVAGRTQSATFPGVTGGADSTFSGVREAYVARLGGDLTRLLQSTYLGGTGDQDGAAAIAVHPVSGDVYIAGTTNSGGGSFPGVAGGAQQDFGGSGAFTGDAFVSRLSSDLTMLLQSTYLGAAGDDAAAGLAVHPATGEVYVGGITTSATAFPQIAGGAQGMYGGGSFPGDGFISRLNSTLTQIVQSTYLGGTSTDYIATLAIHPATGDIYAAGPTNSADFPGTAGGAQPVPGPNGNGDAFVSRLNRNLTNLLQSTWLGGSSTDEALAMAVHPLTGEVYVAGNTRSDAASFPISLPLGAQPAYSAGLDGFVCRLNPALTAINKWTYLGAAGFDSVNGLAINPATGEVYAAGSTDAAAFPGVAGGQQANFGGVVDAFATRLSADLATLLQSTYLGAGADDQGAAVAVHAATGQVYVVGQTSASGATFPGVAGGAQPDSGGGVDVFVSRSSPDLTAANTVPNRIAFLAQSNVPANTLRTSNEVRITGIPVAGNTVVYVTGVPGSQLCATDRSGCCAEPTPVPYCDGAFQSGWVPLFGQLFDNDHVQVRHTSQSPAGTAETSLIIGGVATAFRSSTGNAAFACNLDMNGDNKLDALTEGLVLLRAMFGLTGTAVTSGTGVTTPWAMLSQLLNAGCGTNFR